MKSAADGIAARGIDLVIERLRLVLATHERVPIL
jgi:hypothetical protein